MVSVDGQVAASFEQERAYILDRLGIGVPARNEYRALLVAGAVSADALQDALRALVHRHEILRTCLADAIGRPVQRIADEFEPQLLVEDISSAEDPVEAARDRASEFVAQPFALRLAPLWRVLLVRVDGDRHVLAISMHSAVADANTPALLLREVLGRVAGVGEPGPVRQYREHSERQRRLDPELLDRQEAYWLDALAGDIHPACLPRFGPVPRSRKFRAGRRRSLLSQELVDAAERLADRLGVDVESVLTAGFAALLHRYGSGSDLTFGRTSSTRDASDPMLGPCGNPTTLRQAIDSLTTFESAVAQAADRRAEADLNVDVPFQRINRLVDPGQRPGDGALFRLVFDTALDLPPVNDIPGLDVADLDVPPPFVEHDLHATARRLTDGIVIDWVYDVEVFETSMITQVAAHFVQLLAAALADDRTPLCTLPYLGPSDLAAIRERWNTLRTSYPRECVHRLIEQQVERSPETVAVEWAGARTTYADLNRRANRLARFLRSQGVTDQQMVALCMERSADLIIAVLAIFKAGCVAVPLDPSNPVERLRASVEDAGVRTLVTSGAPVPAFPGVREIRMDTADREAIDRCDDTNLAGGSTADAPAYCIFTSGSTGRPKGVVVEHAALVNIVAWHSRSWMTGSGVRTLLYSPLSFDMSFHEIAVGLCTGGTLVQVDEGTRRNPFAILSFAREHDIAKWYTPFATLQQIARAAKKVEPPTTLRELIVGGEVLRVTPEIRELARRTGCVIHNHYGSTECLEVATHTLSGDPGRWPEVVPIGRPTVDNMNLYVLDERRQPVPTGVVGELYGEGDSLARGYHDRPDLTAERFSHSPFGVQGTTVYRMGDLGRYLPDGTIECLGRADDQVKVRGFRIEVGEIEAVLAQHPAVAECAVRATDVHGRTRLAASVVADAVADASGLPEVLRSFLEDRLPDYMLPATLDVVDELPLTATGKLDRRALTVAGTEPVQARAEADSTADVLAEVWRRLLDVAEIDANKTFFELGGDSILLVQAHEHIEAALGVELPLTTLFRHPTLRSLTRHLEGSGLSSPATRSAPAGRVAGDIAIVGMACRVPGADNLDAFWSNLRNGVDSVSQADDVDLVAHPGMRAPHFVAASGAIDGIDLFDADFFGYSAAEAAVIDPQQRLFLECAAEALEVAGAAVDGGRVGVFAGASLGTYLINNVLPAKFGPGGQVHPALPPPVHGTGCPPADGRPP